MVSDLWPLSQGMRSLVLCLTVLSSTPAVLSLAQRLVKRPNPGQHDQRSSTSLLYRDEDGEATRESLQRFSNKWQRVIVAFLSASGFGTSLAYAIISTIHPANDYYLVQGWTYFGIWVSVRVLCCWILVALTNLFIARYSYLSKQLLYAPNQHLYGYTHWVSTLSGPMSLLF